MITVHVRLRRKNKNGDDAVTEKKWTPSSPFLSLSGGKLRSNGVGLSEADRGVSRSRRDGAAFISRPAPAAKERTHYRAPPTPGPAARRRRGDGGWRLKVVLARRRVFRLRSVCSGSNWMKNLPLPRRSLSSLEVARKIRSKNRFLHFYLVMLWLA